MFKYIYLIFAVFAFFYKLSMTKRIHRMDKIKGKIHQQWVTKLIYLFYILSFICPPVEFLLIKRDINYYISGTFFILYILGWILSKWTIMTMGNYWTVEIEIREDHPLVKKGPYKYMRHPHYLFTFIELFGLPLIANAYYSLILIAIIFIPIYILRITFEEKVMVEKFGDEYLKYKKEVWGFFPIPIFKSGVKE